MILHKKYYPPTAVGKDLVENWQNHYITPSLYYSHRDTIYTAETYPANLHFHDYYEIVLVMQGDIRYLCEGNVYLP